MQRNFKIKTLLH